MFLTVSLRCLTFAAVVMQFSNASQEDHASTPSLLQGLRERAHATLQTTAEVVQEQVALATQAASDRVNTAKAGKRLLDEGGESAAQLVIAKKASRAASELDRSIARRVDLAIFKLDKSVNKLRSLPTCQCIEDATVSPAFSQLADEHEALATACNGIARMLEIPASCAEMSPEEFDALAIVTAKAGCSTVLSRTSDGLESVRLRTLAGETSADTGSDTAESDAIVHAPRVSSGTAQPPTLLQGLQQRARAGLEKVRQVAHDRVETAKAGKKLLDDGGEHAAQVVVAKKACLDAAKIDRGVAERVQCAIGMFDDSAVKLRALQSRHEAGYVSLGDDNLGQLAEEHEMRASTYRQIATMLEEPIGSVDMDLAEWDALSLVKVKDGCDALQCRTNEGFEAVKSLAFTTCTPEGHGEGHRERTVCA